MCGLRVVPGHHDVRCRDRRGRLARAAGRVRRGGWHARRHRGRVLRRGVRGDHRAMALGAPARRDRARRPGDQGQVRHGSGPQRQRSVGAAPDPRPRRIAASARGGRRRPVPGPRVRPVHADGGDAAHARRVRAGRQDPVLRPVELHGVAADQGGADRTCAGPARAGDAAAAVQPHRPRDRVGDRAGRPRRRHRACCPGARSGAAGSPASTGATNGPPATPGSGRTPAGGWRRTTDGAATARGG